MKTINQYIPTSCIAQPTYLAKTWKHGTNAALPNRLPLTWIWEYKTKWTQNLCWWPFRPKQGPWQPWVDCSNLLIPKKYWTMMKTWTILMNSLGRTRFRNNWLKTKIIMMHCNLRLHLVNSQCWVQKSKVPNTMEVNNQWLKWINLKKKSVNGFQMTEIYQQICKTTGTNRT